MAKKVYGGKLTVEIVTTVETNDETLMLKEAHEGFTNELFNEIQTILGARGYISDSIGANLEKQKEDTNLLVSYIEKRKKESIEEVEAIYNKSNNEKYKMKID